MTKILLIDDGSTQLHTLKPALEREGHLVYLAKDGENGIKTAWREMPDVAMFDLFLPIMNGYEVCRRLREQGVPFILVTSHKPDEHSIIKALEMGADDHLRYPIVPAILLAKIKTLTRRTQLANAEQSSVYDDGHLTINLEARQVEVEGKPVKLTPTEYRLLSILLRKAGRVVTHEEIIKEIWGTEKNTSLGSLKLYVHYLRQKIEESPKNPRYLLAEWGVGYRFRDHSTEAV